MVNLWIDDLREPPEKWRKSHFVWAKSSPEAIVALARFDAYGMNIEHISFDHDLGLADTARPVVWFMIEHDIRADNYSVHSSNPPGREWLMGMIERYLR